MSNMIQGGLIFVGFMSILLIIRHKSIKIKQEEAKKKTGKIHKERVSAVAMVEVDGYCATGDPQQVDQLFPAAKARLETTTSDDIVYLGVNPLTTGSELSGMYIDLKELYAAVKQLKDRKTAST